MASSLAHSAAPVLAPALTTSSAFQFLREMRGDLLGCLDRWAEQGGVARFQSRLFVSHLVTAPAAVQHVLQDNPKNYVKEVRSARIFAILLGNGLFLSEGEVWRAQRRVAQPAFHKQHLASMAATMTDAVRAMIERWEPCARSGEPLDLSAETMKFALDVVGRCLVHNDLVSDADAFARLMLDTFDYIMYSLNHLLVPPRFIPTARNRRLRHGMREMDRIVGRVIEHGKVRGGNGGDLLSMLLAAYDPPVGGSPAQLKTLRDNLATYLGAGTETTAVALSWIWYLLSAHPDAQRKLFDEVDSVLNGALPTFDDLPRLPYTKMVIDETLRLYPPAFVVSRTAIADDEVGGFRIPAKSGVFLSSWTTHRSRLYWENPDKFDPERFSPERSRDRHNYAYYPFGGAMSPRMLKFE
ncbi:MAG TPA: cytochrome P450 [Candidatus Binataceae bacterium]|nr:cytochrome P450 [Candidatus Binataceae bacterium]